MKKLLLFFLIPLSGCTVMEITNKALKISQTLNTINQPIEVKCVRTETNTAYTYTIDPSKDEVIVNEWDKHKPESEKTNETWELTERQSTSYVIENISRIEQNKDRKRGPRKVEVNLAIDQVTLSKKLPFGDDPNPIRLICSINTINN